MKFKNTTKKETLKKSTGGTKDAAKDQLTKEEIKELVEETVEEKLEQKEEKHSDISQEREVPSAEESGVEVTEPSEEPKEEGEDHEEDEDKKDASIDQNVSEEMPTEEQQIKISPATPEVMSTNDKTEETKDGDTQKPADATQPDAQSTVGTVPVVSVSTPSDTVTTSTATAEKDANKKSPLILLFIVFLICGFVVGISILFLLSKNNYKIPNIATLVPFGKQAPTPTVTAAATPTPEIVDVAKYKISVLNGSGVAGAAGQTKDDLTTAGFTVTNTGNATDDVTETTIAAKSSVDQATLSKLTETLSKKYTVSSQVTSLKDAENTDIVVTLGPTK